MIESTIYHYSECTCLPHENHYNRYFLIETPHSYEPKKVAFCNSFLRLKMQESKKDERYFCFSPYDFTYTLRALLCDIIDFGDTSWNHLKINNKLNRYFHFNILERPYIYLNYSIADASNLIINGANNQNFIERYLNCIDGVFYNYKETYSKSKYKSIIDISRRIKRNVFDRENENRILDLATEMFELHIKIKL